MVVFVPLKWWDEFENSCIQLNVQAERKFAKQRNICWNKSEKFWITEEVNVCCYSTNFIPCHKVMLVISWQLNLPSSSLLINTNDANSFLNEILLYIPFPDLTCISCSTKSDGIACINHSEDMKRDECYVSWGWETEYEWKTTVDISRMWFLGILGQGFLLCSSVIVS